MDGGSESLGLLKFAAVAVLVLGLAAHQIYALKKLALKRLEKDRARNDGAASAR
jgi:hypothetical protein